MSVLECVVNLSGGRDSSRLQEIVAAASNTLLDVHADTWHNRSVPDAAARDVVEAALAVARAAIRLLDINAHEGVHPRLGVVDVVPFVPLGASGFGGPIELDEALQARDQSATAGGRPNLACRASSTGPSGPCPRSDGARVRRPRSRYRTAPPHPTAGACCVGARPCLVAYNLYLEGAGLDVARRLASPRSSARRRFGRSGLRSATRCRSPATSSPLWSTGPAEIYDEVRGTNRRQSNRAGRSHPRGAARTRSPARVGASSTSAPTGRSRLA